MSITINGNVLNSNVAERVDNSKMEVNVKVNDIENIKSLIPNLRTEISNGNYDEGFQKETLEKLDELQAAVDADDCSSAKGILQNIIQGAIASGVWSIGSSLFCLLDPFKQL